VTRLSGPALRQARRDVQMIFQDPYASLNPRLTVFESVTEPLAIHEPSVGRAERRTRAAALLERVGLPPDHLDRYPHQFSGGQRQRLAIARALCLGPKVIVADEPVSALDASVRAQVLDLMRELQRDLGVAYLFVSHDMAVIEQMSHRVAVMVDGRIVEIGPTRSVLFDPRHPYTRKLIASVPVPDPTRRRIRSAVLSEAPSSPVRPIGWQRPAVRMIEVAPGHLVDAAGLPAILSVPDPQQGDRPRVPEAV
jgi:ABC-type glutathione transport system ATPase component